MKLLNARISLALVVVTCTSFADSVPSAAMILEAQKDLVEVKQSKAHIGQIDIEICPTSVCDLFESQAPVTLQALTDYVYLYALYVGKYVDFSASTPPGKYALEPFISDGLKKGYGDEIAAHYRDVPGCSATDDRSKCISALEKKFSIKRFVVRYDEGARTVTPAGN